MYLFNRNKKGISRKTRDILILIICMLFVINVVQLFLGRSTNSSSNVMRQALVNKARENIDAALSVVPQLGRMGGSSTLKWLSMTRQYLYGITQINDLSDMFLGIGQNLVSQETVNAAVSAIDTCESLLSSGNNMDTPLNELWVQLNALSDSISNLEQ